MASKASHGSLRVRKGFEKTLTKFAAAAPPTTFPKLPPGLDAAPDKGKDHKRENLKFLLQKELRNSDVGPLGRMVLPKKEAEEHLLTLSARQGMQIHMDDMHLSRKWNFKYKYWPNSKSRNYIMENNGEFVKIHGLGHGDFIMLYKDEINDKYRSLLRPQNLAREFLQ